MRSWSYLCKSCNSWGGRRWYSKNKDRAISGQRDRHLAECGTKAELKRVDGKRAYYEANKPKWREYGDRSRAKARTDPAKLASSLLVYTRRRCQILGIEFRLEVSDIEPTLRAGRCPVTGIEFDLAIKRGKLPFSPSLDRIEPAAGYVPGNVRVVVWIYNLARSSWGDETVLKMAQALCKPKPPP